MNNYSVKAPKSYKNLKNLIRSFVNSHPDFETKLLHQSLEYQSHIRLFHFSKNFINLVHSKKSYQVKSFKKVKWQP